MNITYPAVKTIFDTLPIGYYLGRNIYADLSETSKESAFFVFEDKIVISYPSIAAAVEKIESLTDDEIESIVRGLLYHEISHVLLTPSDLIKIFRRPTEHDVINIFEDERIETLYKDVYMNVNFKRNLAILIGLTPPKNVLEAFFNLVRFRQGEEYWTNRVKDLINKYASLNAISNRYESEDYGHDVIRLYYDFAESYNKDSENGEDGESNDKSEGQPGESSSGSGSSSSSSSGSSKSSDGSSSDSPSEDGDSSSSSSDSSASSGSSDSSAHGDSSSSNSDNSEDNKSDKSKSSSSSASNSDDKSKEGKAKSPQELLEELLNSIEKKMEGSITATSKSLKKTASKILNKYFDEKLNYRLADIVNNKLKQNKQNGSAINSYSGRINPRAVGTRDDYRWWTQQNRSGHIKQFSKVHFNLFIDNSGSFWANDDNMNIFIQTLDRVEKENSDFTFDVITINMNVVEWPDHHRQFQSFGGNKLMPSISSVIRKHTKASCNNYNIVLFDGDAHSDDEYGRRRSGERDPFKIFDTSNTIIVTDPQNERYLKEANMSQAAVRYCTEYCKMFTNVICDLLERAI